MRKEVASCAFAHNSTRFVPFPAPKLLFNLVLFNNYDSVEILKLTWGDPKIEEEFRSQNSGVRINQW
ncbi:hypothetical protein, partial [Nostoc sp.]